MTTDRKSNDAFRTELASRMRALSVAVFKFVDALPKKCSTTIIANQLGRSASSIGANYIEATRAESRADFGRKLQIALKEAAESCYWLEILVELYPMHATAARLASECMTLRNLLQSIAKSVRMPKQPKHSKTQTPPTHDSP